MTIHVYGIKNCDSVKKAIKWLITHLTERKDEVKLYDYRVDNINKKLLAQFLEVFSLDQLINKKSTTWRSLTTEQQNNINVELLLNNPTLIKRPIIVDNDKVLLIGFDQIKYQQAFNLKSK